MNLIGQFGVGFYSAFLVANKVVVMSKTPREPEQHIWISTADGKFTITKDPRGNTLKRGTKIILHLKEDAIEFVEADKIKELVKRYSQFINYPIYLWVSKDVTKQVDEKDYNDDDNTYEEVSDKELDEMDDVDVETYKRKEGGPEKPKSTEDVDVKEASEDSETDSEPKQPEEPKK